MAVPGPNQWTNPPVPVGFVAPFTDAYNPLTMRCPGGVALNDGSQGREVQIWTINYDGSAMNVLDGSMILRFQLAVDGVLSCCLAFDSNMAVAIAYMKADGGYLYYFDSQTNSYQTKYFSDITSCRVTVDKTTRFFEGQSDVVWGYVRGLVVYYRIQRDRYNVEYLAPLNGVVLSLANPLIRFAPALDNRLQAELFVPSPPPPPPPPPPVLGATRKLPLPTLPVVRVVKVTPEYS